MTECIPYENNLKGSVKRINDGLVQHCSLKKSSSVLDIACKVCWLSLTNMPGTQCLKTLLLYKSSSHKKWVFMTIFGFFNNKKSHPPSLSLFIFKNILHSPPLGQCLKQSYFLLWMASLNRVSVGIRYSMN